jgi:hypothetical protein
MALQNYIVRTNKVTNINEIQKEIQKALQAYSYEVSNDLDIAKNEVANKLKKDLSQDSPEKTGDYKKGWRIKKFKKAHVVYNKTDYQLTHLLEHGHVKINGGRTDAQIHIRPNEQIAIKDFLKRVDKAVKR